MSAVVRATLATGPVDVVVGIERPGARVMVSVGGTVMALTHDQALTLAAQIMGVSAVSAVQAGETDAASWGQVDPDQIMETARQGAVRAVRAWRAAQS